MIAKHRSLFSNKYFLGFLSTIALSGYSMIVFAATPPAGGFTPGAELNPTCIPGHSIANGDPYDCFVKQAWQQNVVDGFVYNDTDMVGIGTDTPTHTLDVMGDFHIESVPAPGEMMFQIQGDLSPILGSGNGMMWYTGDDAFGAFAFSALKYSAGAGTYLLNVSDLVNTASIQLTSTTGQFAVDGNLTLESNGGQLSLMSDGAGDIDASLVLPSNGTFSLIANPSDDFSVGLLSNTDGSLNIYHDSNISNTNMNIYFNPASTAISLGATDGVTSGNMYVESNQVGMHFSTLSSQNDGSGTPLVIQVSDENTRGGGFSARSRNLSYANAGADMFVWDNALGGDRTWIWMDETKIDSGLNLTPSFPGAFNYTTNNATEISFQFHTGDTPNYSKYSITDDFRWQKTGGDLMSINGNTGYVFIGTGVGQINAAYRLQVIDDTATSYAASFLNDGNNANRYGVVIGAGEDSGTGTLLQFNDGDGTSVGSITFSGTTTTYGTSSDRRLKENINTTRYTLQDVLDIQVHDYTFIAEGTGKVHTGFIAQELYDIYPEAVFAPTDGRMWSVDYGKITPLLVKAVQELDIKIKNIESSVADQDSRLLGSVQQWLASATNGITRIFTDRVDTKQLCVEDVCVTRDQFLLIVQQSGGQQNVPVNPPAPIIEEEEETETVIAPEIPVEETSAPQEEVVVEAPVVESTPVTE